MLHVAVSGGTKRKRELCLIAAPFFCSSLLPRKHPVIELDICLKRKLRKEYSIFGECFVNENNRSNSRPTCFTINIDSKLKLDTLLLTLAHEMVHLKQYATGQLYDYSRDSLRYCRWLNKKIDYTKLDYWDYPWEIDAHGRERGLTIRFLESINNNKLKTKDFINLYN